MTRRVILTITDEQAERLSWLADHYDADAREIAFQILIEGIAFCEHAIEQEACEQIRMLMEAPAMGRA